MKSLLKTSVGATVQTFIHRAADGALMSKSPVRSNLVLDAGLNQLAGQFGAMGFARFFECCKLGSGSISNSTASGAITFTQAATTVTASAGFFTAGMVGQLLKYGTGTGGAEYYITAYTSPTVVTVDTSATVAATVGTVWNVSQTTLGNYIALKSVSYVTTGGGCGTTFGGGNTVTLKRSFLFPVQGSAYVVNEIGYTAYNVADNTCSGRIVLGSTDSVSTSNYYVVVITMTYTVSPSTVTSYVNVGTNINVAGTGNYGFFDFKSVSASSGNTVSYQADANAQSWANCFMDNGIANGNYIGCVTSAFTVATSISTAAETSTGRAYMIAMGNFAHSGAAGNSVASGTFNFSTAGETLYGFEIGTGQTTAQSGNTFRFLLTTPVILPVGNWSGSLAIQNVYGRTLVN